MVIYVVFQETAEHKILYDFYGHYNYSIRERGVSKRWSHALLAGAKQ